MILFQNKTTRVNKEVKVEEGVESGTENVLVCVEASAVLKAEFYISIVSVPTVVEFYWSESIKCQARLKNRWDAY